MKIIDFPGSLCLDIYHFIALNPGAAMAGWRVLFMGLILFLAGTTAYPILYPNKTGPSGYLKKLLSPSTFIFVLCIGILILRLPNFILVEQNPDESEWIANAASYWHGAVLWKSVGGNTSGPLVYAPVSVIAIFSGMNYATIRLFGLLVCMLPAIYLLWRTLSMLCGDMVARLCLIQAFIFFGTANKPDIIAYNSEHMPIVLIMLSIYLVFTFAKGGRFPIIKLALCGIALGMLPYAKLQAVPIGFGIGLLAIVAIVIRPLASLKAKGIYFSTLFSGALIPSIAVGIYLTAHNCWGAFWNEYIVQNFNFKNEGLSPFIPPEHGFKGALHVIFLLMNGRWSMLLFVVASFVFFLIFIFSRFDRATLKRIFFSKTLAAGLFIVLCTCYSIIAPGSSSGHYLLFLIMPFILFTGIIMSRLLSAEDTMGARRILSLMFLIPCIIYSLFFISHYKIKGIELVAQKEDYHLSDVSKTILKYAHPNELMSIWGWVPHYFVQTGLIQANTYAHSFFATRWHTETPPYLKYVSEVSSNKPIIFLDNAGGPDPLFTVPYRHETYPKLDSIITGAYTMVGEFDGARVYVINTRLQEMGLSHP